MSEPRTMKTKLKHSKKFIALFVIISMVSVSFLQQVDVAVAQTDPACLRNAECGRTATPPSTACERNAECDRNTTTLSQDAQCVGSASQCVTSTTDPATNCKNQDCDVIQKYLNPFIVLLSILVGIAVTIGIIIGGIQYASSGGDPQKAASGKKHIMSAVIALIAFIFLNAFISFLLPGAGILK